MLSQLLALSFGLKIFLLIVFLLVVAAASVFLFLGIRKDHIKYKYERRRVKDFKKEEFDALLKTRLESGEPMPFALIFVQINAAKELKEQYGEDYYAWVLGTIRERVALVLPHHCKVCLYEYDTYAFLIDGDYSVDALNDYSAQCILKAHMPVSYGVIKKKITSPELIVGAASHDGTLKLTTEVFLRQIEIALAVSGRGGVNDYVVYTPELFAGNTDYHYYRELKDAINDGAFTLCFQPIRNLVDGSPIAYEMLLHWNHSEYGALRPEKFLHIMERSGDMNWVGLWAYEQTLIAYRKFLKAHPDSHAIFSVNLTLHQLLDAEISNDIYRITAKYGVPPYVICFEIGEAAILGRDLAVRENLEKLSQCGFLLAIDNFTVDDGTLTQLEYKKELFNWVKLDKSFTATVQAGTPDIKNIQRLLELSQENKIAVIAQDIKDGITESFIERIGIFCGQGYALGNAEPIESYLEARETAVVTKTRERKGQPAAEPMPQKEQPAPAKEQSAAKPAPEKEKTAQPASEKDKAAAKPAPEKEKTAQPTPEKEKTATKPAPEKTKTATKPASPNGKAATKPAPEKGKPTESKK